MESARRYAAFATTATSVYLTWVAIVAAAAIAAKLYLLRLDEIASLPSSVEVHSLWFNLGWDLICTTVAAPFLIAVRRYATRKTARVPLWVDVVGAMLGVALAVGFVCYMGLAIGGHLPAMGLRPNGWAWLTVYSVVTLGAVLGTRAVLRRRVRVAETILPQ